MLASVRLPFRLPRFPAPPQRTVAFVTLLGSIAWSLLALGDSLVGKVTAPFALLSGLSVAILVGAMVGAAIALVFHWLSRFRARWWTGVWSLAGLGWSLTLVLELGVFQALRGQHAKLAWLALGASVALGIYLIGVAWLCQPRQEMPRGLAGQLSPRWRAVISSGLVLIVAATLLIDTYGFPLTYPAAHVALRWAAVVSVMAFLWVVTGRVELDPRRSRAVRWVAGGLIVAALPAVLIIGEKDRVTLDALLRRPILGLGVQTLRQITDVDRDGYSSLLGGGDCAPFTRRVNPGAEEIPENGIDDNCVGGDASIRSAYDVSTVVMPKEPPPVSVIVISIDTLRADRMSLYGYHRKTTPNIDEWAKSALRFQRSYTGGPWTALALSSMFRGVYPRRLAWTFLWETSHIRLLRMQEADEQLRKGERKLKVFATPIDDKHRTLSEWLSLRGMRTEAVVDDGRSQFLDRRLRISGDWDHYEMADLRGARRGDASVTFRAERRLKRLAKGPPFFLWVHYFGPHESPRQDEGPPRYGNSRSDLYDHKLNSTDEEVGKLLKAIDSVQHDHPIAVILTSDHGEEFLADHRGHGANLKDSNIRVPLLVRGPGFRAGTSSTVVSLIDVLPTVLTWTGIPLPKGLDGRPLQELWADEQPRTVLSETWRFNQLRAVAHDRIAAISDDFKLEMNLIDRSAQLRRIGPTGSEESNNLIDMIERPTLFAEINLYLEQNRKVKVSE